MQAETLYITVDEAEALKELGFVRTVTLEMQGGSKELKVLDGLGNWIKEVSDRLDKIAPSDKKAKVSHISAGKKEEESK